jgi:hypothetical protein
MSADVVALFSYESAVVYRAPMNPQDDPYRPKILSWVYEGNAVRTIRAALTMPGLEAWLKPTDPTPIVLELAKYATTRNAGRLRVMAAKRTGVAPLLPRRGSSPWQSRTHSGTRHGHW